MKSRSAFACIQLGLLCGLVLPHWSIFAPREAAAAEPVAHYEQIHNRVYLNEKKYLDNFAKSGGDVKTNGYYRFQYVLMGTLAMYEATGNETYLKRALDWGAWMVNAAKKRDKNGFLHWPGPNNEYGIIGVMHFLGQSQGTTELARMARIVLTDRGLRAKYGIQANRIYVHVRKNYAELRWNKDIVAWHNKLCRDRQRLFLDRIMMAGRILKDLWLIDGNQRYGDMAKSIADCFAERFQPYKRDSIIWDLGMGYANEQASSDTDHANRVPELLIDFYEAGLIFDRSYLTGVARLFTNVIWNGSRSNPLFANFISGSNETTGLPGSLGEWGYAVVYRGWAWLASYDCTVYEAQDALLAAIEAGKNTPATRRNRTVWGRLAITGHLARAAAMKCDGWQLQAFAGSR